MNNVFNENYEKSNKLLNCLLELERLTNLYGVLNTALFEELVHVIPPAFQFPEITGACIEISSEKFQTSNYQESPWELDHEIRVGDESVGRLKINYLEEKTSAYKGPFLKEEVVLGRAIADHVSLIAGHRRLEQNQNRGTRDIDEAKLDTISKFSRGIAHDFNNLLMVVNGYSRFILGSIETSDPVYADITEINKAGDMGVALIRRLVSFTASPKLQITSVDLNTVLPNAKRPLVKVAGENIEFVINLTAYSASVKIDVQQFGQVLFSLIENSKEAMPKGGKITVGVSRILLDDLSCSFQRKEFLPGQYVTVVISDTGTGMSSDIQMRAFDPFCSTKRKRLGLGLGLPYAQKFIRQCNGYITIHSKENIGTDLAIYLPYDAEGTSSEGQGDNYPNAGKRNQTIMIVDNDEQSSGLIAEVLEDHGYRTVNTTSGTESLRICESQQSVMDLVLTNDTLPDMSGWWLAKKMQMINPKLPVIVQTLFASLIPNEDEISHTKITIRKPINIPSLLPLLKRILGEEGLQVSGQTPDPLAFFIDRLKIPKLIMVVSNRIELGREIRLGLKCFGRTVIHHRNSADALADLKNLDQVVDCVIIDTCLDDITFHECIHNVDKINSDLTVAILTNNAMKNSKEIPQKVLKLKVPLTKAKLKEILA